MIFSGPFLCSFMILISLFRHFRFSLNIKKWCNILIFRTSFDVKRPCDYVWWRCIICIPRPRDGTSSSHVITFNSSLPLSETIEHGTPWRQIQQSKNDLAIVAALLSGIAESYVYLEKSSVITSIYFVPEAEQHLKAPKRFKLWREDGWGFLPESSWQRTHLEMKVSMS